MVGTVPISVRLHRRCHRGGLCASLLLIACVVLMNMVAEETESGAKGTSEVAKKTLPPLAHTLEKESVSMCRLLNLLPAQRRDAKGSCSHRAKRICSWKALIVHIC